MKALTPAEIEEMLHTHTHWKLHEGKLVREWTFKDFVQAMSFVNRVAELAEAAGHHPDIDIRYNRVQLALISHDSGGITHRDTAMVASLDSQMEATT
jgi:4a-hydroxytetrahydrobiopterin dehydratase